MPYTESAGLWSVLKLDFIQLSFFVTQEGESLMID